MSKCENCASWVVSCETRYGNGDVIVTWTAEDGKGRCAQLGIEVPADFGCNRFFEMLSSGSHVEVTQKPGAPWNHFVMIPCPDCGGKGDGGRGHRCAGTGNVRLYDDGYVGDEQTRKHPKETAEPLLCPGCKRTIPDINWKHCPDCAAKLFVPAETEVIPLDIPTVPPRGLDSEFIDPETGSDRRYD